MKQTVTIVTGDPKNPYEISFEFGDQEDYEDFIEWHDGVCTLNGELGKKITLSILRVNMHS